jgi:hypothetical protein
MNYLLRPRIWPSFQASSVVGPCDVPFRYASEPIPRCRGTVARWHAHLCGLATAIHEISGLEGMEPFLFDKLSFSPRKVPGLKIIQAICLPEAVWEGALWRD